MNYKNALKRKRTWNGHRLISALAELIVEDRCATSKICTDFISKTHQQRIYSVLCAVYELNYNENKMCEVIEDFANGKYVYKFDGNEPTFNKLCKFFSKNSKYDFEQISQILTNSKDCSNLFSELLKTRQMTEKFATRNDGVLAGTRGLYLGHQLSESIYSCISQSDNELENIMIQLLGEHGKFSLTETDLKKDYHYPKTTDDELTDYLIDNF